MKIEAIDYGSTGAITGYTFVIPESRKIHEQIPDESHVGYRKIGFHHCPWCGKKLV